MNLNEGRAGIPLKTMAQIIRRLAKKYPKGLLRVTSNGIWMIRHTKTNIGYDSEFVEFTEEERKAIDKARKSEESNLIDNTSQKLT